MTINFTKQPTFTEGHSEDTVYPEEVDDHTQYYLEYKELMYHEYYDVDLPHYMDSY